MRNHFSPAGKGQAGGTGFMIPAEEQMGATPPLAPRLEEAHADGLPERIGTVIGAVIFALCLALVLWPIVRHFT